jgi:CheY-like chemotaxis protein
MAKRFLLIDDDSDDRELFSEALSLVGPEIICEQATDAMEGLQLLQNLNRETPDIIFLDINLPVIDGWQFLTRLKESGLKNIPVIMYSTSSNAWDAKRSREMGALCFITKPHAFQSLQGILGVVVEYANKANYDKLCEAVHKAIN